MLELKDKMMGIRRDGSIVMFESREDMLKNTEDFGKPGSPGAVLTKVNSMGDEIDTSPEAQQEKILELIGEGRLLDDVFDKFVKIFGPYGGGFHYRLSSLRSAGKIRSETVTKDGVNKEWLTRRVKSMLGDQDIEIRLDTWLRLHPGEVLQRCDLHSGKNPRCRCTLPINHPGRFHLFNTKESSWVEINQ